MNVYILRVGDQRGKWWVFSDGKYTLPGKIGQSRQSVYDWWLTRYGIQPGAKLIRYRGVHRPSEAAMTLASIQQEREST